MFLLLEIWRHEFIVELNWNCVLFSLTFFFVTSRRSCLSFSKINHITIRWLNLRVKTYSINESKKLDFSILNILIVNIFVKILNFKSNKIVSR